MGNIWVCLKMLCTPTPNGFADHYPVFKWLFHWEYTLFSDKPIWENDGRYGGLMGNSWFMDDSCPKKYGRSVGFDPPYGKNGWFYGIVIR